MCQPSTLEGRRGVQPTTGGEKAIREGEQRGGAERDSRERDKGKIGGGKGERERERGVEEGEAGSSTLRGVWKERGRGS